MSFSALKLHPDLLKAVKELGFAQPTPIQTEAIPPAMAGRDVLACAMTGSGKTAAFLLPILHQLIGRPRGTTRVLVLTPTRELAAQILEDLNELAVHTPITGAAIFGGVAMGPQEHAFRTGTDVLVATPGRLLDHLTHGYARLDGLTHLVVDEADRMLDMGFLPQIRRVLKQLPKRRQTLFFSATIPALIVQLSGEILDRPVQINVQRQAAPAVGITQAVYPVPQHLKPALLVTLLERGDIRDALVFTRTKHRADRLSKFLVQQGVVATRIHGNRSQAQRTEALAGFKSARYRVLVATDIAARGIDVAALGHVVNFDVPTTPDDYIHRVGRTARAEATGDAYTFFCPEEEDDLLQIERVVGKRLPRVTVPDFDYQAPPPPKAAGTLGRSGSRKPSDAGSRRGSGTGRSSGQGRRRVETGKETSPARRRATPAPRTTVAETPKKEKAREEPRSRFGRAPQPATRRRSR